MDDDFIPWVTPLLAKLYQGPFPVGGVLIYGPDVEACRDTKRVSLECFYGLNNVMEVQEDGAD